MSGTYKYAGARCISWAGHGIVAAGGVQADISQRALGRRTRRKWQRRCYSIALCTYTLKSANFNKKRMPELTQSASPAERKKEWVRNLEVQIIPPTRPALSPIRIHSSPSCTRASLSSHTRSTRLPNALNLPKLKLPRELRLQHPQHAN